ncbi:lanthionine synthetase LanC family protein [Gemmatimonas aurantiaca]|uniref:lanthionine synthetase LanC family protein n=1 Tax=Gemmatimonas aurantiaca TaxID=173480 RepID=UPI00301D5F0C
MTSWQIDTSVYRGSAGIGLFLAELYGEIHDPELLRVARGALRHAVNNSGSVVLPWSAFSGIVGIVYALGRLAAVSGDGRAADDVRMLWRRLESSNTHVQGDVISGAAGAIPLLMQLEHLIDRKTIEQVVHRLGTTMQRAAVHTVSGTAWRGVPTAHRPLTGFAHGASGYAYALLAAWQYCGASRFLYTALQAILYERVVYDRGIRNWPDFRHSEFGKLIWDFDEETSQSMVRSGWEPAPYQLHGMHAWCHGAPGIGLVRLRAAERLGLPWLWREAHAAADATSASIDRETHNWSLCHGIAGNSEFLIAAAGSLGRPDLRECVLELAAAGDETFESRGVPWPSGSADRLPDPCLLLGDAGIGLHYLRLHAPHVPSVLFPALPSPTGAAFTFEQSDAIAYRRELMRTLFRHADGLPDGDDLDGLAGAWNVRASRPDLSTVASCVRRRRSTLTDDAARGAIARDLACVEPGERQLSDVQRRMDGFLVRPPGEILWSGTCFRLRGDIAIHGVRAERRGGRIRPYMVRPDPHGQCVAEDLTPLAALVLDAYGSAARMDDVAVRISVYVNGERRARIRALVEEQTRSAYEAGFLVCAPEPDMESAAGNAKLAG